jgi:hypothetical protein
MITMKVTGTVTVTVTVTMTMVRGLRTFDMHLPFYNYPLSFRSKRLIILFMMLIFQ